MTCYGQYRMTNGKTVQEVYETASRDARRRATQLRRAGYAASVSSMGPQVTSVGTIKLTMVTISNPFGHDVCDLPDVTIEKL